MEGKRTSAPVGKPSFLRLAQNAAQSDNKQRRLSLFQPSPMLLLRPVSPGRGGRGRTISPGPSRPTLSLRAPPTAAEIAMQCPEKTAAGAEVITQHHNAGGQ